MPLCIGICKDGTICRFKAKVGHSVCGKHMAQDQEPLAPTHCNHVMTNRQECGKLLKAGEVLCKRHQTTVTKRKNRHDAAHVWGEAIHLLWINRDTPGARQYLTTARANGAISVDWYEYYIVEIEHEIMFFEGIAPPGQVVKGQLHALSIDGQNVHTFAVATQTSTTMDLLLNTPVSSFQDTFHELYAAWDYTVPPVELRRIGKDMVRWYETDTCRAAGDYLYKRTLDGLWSRIRMSKDRDALAKRLREECAESVGMCCEGHLSRLCNVLVGFDSAFTSPISAGEMLQMKMAAIAELDVSVEHKVGKAWVVFQDLDTPMDERMSWLEAF